jgi:2-hydroxychromene-2-carboxylate isomerase
LRFALPAPFPQNSLVAARLALAGSDEGWIAPFTRAVFAAEFGQGADIAQAAVLGSILDGLGLDSGPIFSRIEQPDIKARLRQQTADAEGRGIFGAPSFICHGELFWGDDRLERALDRAVRT